MDGSDVSDIIGLDVETQRIIGGGFTSCSKTALVLSFEIDLGEALATTGSGISGGVRVTTSVRVATSVGITTRIGSGPMLS